MLARRAPLGVYAPGFEETPPAMHAPAETTKPRSQTWFFGHSTGLATLSFTEAWVGFSYYGMMSLLTLYMTSYLLKAPHEAHILFFAPFHAFLNGLYGNRQGPALASSVTGLYSALAYGVPVLGGMLADNFLGRTRTIVLGAVLMTAGHLLMAFESTFLIALALIIAGMGCAGTIKAQVGGLYSIEDTRRADAYQVFLLLFNIAVIIAPLVCGTLGESYHWSWGFGAAGVGMAVGLVVYLAGQKTLPPEPVRLKRAERTAASHPALTRREKKTLIVLALLLPVLAISAIGNQEIFNGYMIWGKKYYQLVFFGHVMPVAWLLSLDAFISSGMIFGVLMFWRWYEKLRGPVDEIVKVAIGAGFNAVAPLLLAVASLLADQGHHKVGLIWGVGFHLVNDLGFSNVYAIGMSLYSRSAPKRMGATVVNAFVLHIFLANLFVGYLAGLLESMSAPSFWLLHAGLIAGAAVILIVCARIFRPILAPVGADEPDLAEVAG